VNNIKIDFVYYPYNWIEKPLTSKKIRIASKADIAAMKLNAISGRGSKKDFIDIFFLLNDYSLADMIGFYKQKYPEGSEFLVLKSLCYFNDAETEHLPAMLRPVKWEQVKNTVRKCVNVLVS
jgi:hypothetical protein